jgi:hypothetical protein
LQNYCRSQFIRQIPGVSVSSQLKIHRLVKKLGQATFKRSDKEGDLISQGEKALNGIWARLEVFPRKCL